MENGELNGNAGSTGIGQCILCGIGTYSSGRGDQSLSSWMDARFRITYKLQELPYHSMNREMTFATPFKCCFA